MSLRITLIRHGQTDWNLEKRFQGHEDVPLNPSGHDQAARLADRLGQIESRPRALLTSDLRRAKQTTAALEARLGLEAEPHRDWRERNLGIFEGYTRAEMQEQLPEAYAGWRGDVTGYTPERGESYRAQRGRIERALDELSGRFQEGEIWVVTHGGCVYAALAIVHGLELPPDPAIRIANTALTTFVREGGTWLVDVLNDAAHLDEP